MSNIESIDETGPEPAHYFQGKVGGKSARPSRGTRYMHGNTEVGRVGRRKRKRDGEKEVRGPRAGNPNEYLISAYLTPGKVQSDGMAGSLPQESGRKRAPCPLYFPAAPVI